MNLANAIKGLSKPAATKAPMKKGPKTVVPSKMGMKGKK